MKMSIGRVVRGGEAGHAPAGVAVLVGAVGAILLAIAVANDSDALAIIGGIVLAVGLVAESLVSHAVVDYDIFRRLEKLEK